MSIDENVAGYGLSIYDAGDGANTTSYFGIRADRMFMAGPSYVSDTAPTVNVYNGMSWFDGETTRYWTGTEWSQDPTHAPTPLIVLATPTVIDGQTVEPGVYMDAAYIRSGTMDFAAIQRATIDWAYITQGLFANQITAIDIQFDKTLRSTRTIDGEPAIELDGTTGRALLNNAVVRGTVYATDGEFSGKITSDDAFIKGTIAGGAARGRWEGSGLWAYSSDDGYRFRLGRDAGPSLDWNIDRLNIWARHSSRDKIAQFGPTIEDSYIEGIFIRDLTADSIVANTITAGNLKNEAVSKVYSGSGSFTNESTNRTSYVQITPDLQRDFSFDDVGTRKILFQVSIRPTDLTPYDLDGGETQTGANKVRLRIVSDVVFEAEMSYMAQSAPTGWGTFTDSGGSLFSAPTGFVERAVHETFTGSVITFASPGLSGEKLVRIDTTAPSGDYYWTMLLFAK
jgi:hypothetical protein